MATIRHIRRANLRRVLDRLTTPRQFIFSVVCQRRRPLYLRYEPKDQYTNGALAHVGDRSLLHFRTFVKGSKRKIELQPAGMLRTVVVKRKTNLEPMKHWRSKGGELPFDPASRGLYLVAGVYSDQPKDYGTGTRPGRHGQWRPWVLLDLLTTVEVRHNGVRYVCR